MVEPKTETVDPGAPDGIGDEIASEFPNGDRYEVRGLLGRGGFATVYRAYDRELRREVALKVLRADRVSPAALQRFRREVAVARDAASDHLVRVFDIDRSGPSPFLTLELIEGGSLADRLAQGPLPIEEAVRIAIQILEGLQALHALKIVHRDVKPGNVLLTATGTVKLADFGLARHLEREETWATQPDSILGTLLYLSPEQALGREVDVRSDLYSVGLVLFEMLTGRLPHEGRSALGSLLGHLHEDAPDVRTWRPDAPRWLAAVVRRLLARNPAERYPSAATVLADLKARARPRPRHRRRVATLAIAAFVLLLASVAPAAWERWWASRFSHLVATGSLGVAAISHDGRTLWTAPNAEMNAMVLARLKPGDSPTVVGVLDSYKDAAAAHTLSVLEPESGKPLRQVQLPDGATYFPGFANTFHPILSAVDLDGDGSDEIVATYIHSPWWPSYTVLYEPRIERPRVVFVASGHHRFTDAFDLDGDGRVELLFAGINNRMGWYTGIAAVRLVPWVNDTATRGQAVASSPDQAYSLSSARSLLWYSLGPRERFVNENRPLTIEPATKTLSLMYDNDRSFALGFKGFPAGMRFPLPASERESARRQTYFRLREGERLLTAGDPDWALEEFEAARRSVGRAGERFLVDWVERSRARGLVAAGRLSEGEAAFEKLMRTSEAASDIAFDAGKAFHLAGLLERAVAWYRRSRSRGGSDEAGRGKWEYLEGTVLALAELGRYEEGMGEIDTFTATYPMERVGEVYREYLRWQTAAPRAWQDLEITGAGPDLQRYWLLELRLAGGYDARRLLSEVEEELPRSSESRPQLLSLQGEILARLRRPADAARAAKEGYELAQRQRHVNTGVRAHFYLIAQRTARLARATKDETTAREVERELAPWTRERRARR